MINKILLKLVYFPLLSDYIEDDQCWHCHKYEECFGK
jgi:hypothetical protein